MALLAEREEIKAALGNLQDVVIVAKHRLECYRKSGDKFMIIRYRDMLVDLMEQIKLMTQDIELDG